MPAVKPWPSRRCRHRRPSRHRLQRRIARTVAVLALSCGFVSRSLALDLGDDNLALNSTIARQEWLKTWDNAKLYGAERIADRNRKLFLPDGVRAGNYLLFPTIGTAVLFDDNIYATNKNRVSDVRFELVPVVRAKSQLPRHILDFAVGAKLTKYAKHDELDTNDATFTADGALHFDHAHTLAVSVLSALEHEDRAAPEAPRNAVEKTQVFHNRAIVGLKRDSGRMYANFSAKVERWDFEDVKARNGSTIDQDGRDTQILSAQTLFGYRLSPGFELQTKLRTLRQTYSGSPALDFTATGYEAVAGVAAQLNPLLRWRLLGGYGIRDYDNAKLTTAGHSLLEAEVQWLPTQLMTIYATARRAYSEGISDDGVGGRIDNELSVKVDYEVLRNLVFTLGGEYRESEFLGDSRRDRVTTGRVGFDYHHTKNWLFSMNFEHQNQQSNVDEDNLTRNRLWFGTKLRF